MRQVRLDFAARGIAVCASAATRCAHRSIDAGAPPGAAAPGVRGIAHPAHEPEAFACGGTRASRAEAWRWRYLAPALAGVAAVPAYGRAATRHRGNRR